MLHIPRLALALTLLCGVLGTGCVTNGRKVLLKEYGPSVPEESHRPLAGITVCVLGFESAPDLVSLKVETEPEEPKPFKYKNQSREEDKAWSKEMRALQKQSKNATLREIGNMRNGFGMVMSHVYALNDPADWLRDSLRFDLEAQGAKVVDASHADEAAVSVSGRVLRCGADMYMVINGTLVVDVELKPRQGDAVIRRIHTHGATTAVLASEGEYFHALRDARQKFSILVTQDLLRIAAPGT